MLEIKDLTISISDRYLIKNLNLILNNGDKLAIIGEEGNGKSTLLKSILDICEYAEISGNINLKGNRIGYLEQSISTDKLDKSVYEFLFIDESDYYDKINNLYKYLDLINLTDDILKQKIKTLSGGEKVKISILKLLLNEYDILFLDEPTNGLDPEGIKQIKDLIVKLAKEENMAVLISSHNLLELESFCTKVTIIKNGEIVETSTIEEAKKVNKESIYHFVVDKVIEVSNILENEVERIDDENIQVYAKKEEIPEIIEKLVTSGVKIYSVYPEEMSLEDAFLKKTGGNVID